jgi:hypothetical protein
MVGMYYACSVFVDPLSSVDAVCQTDEYVLAIHFIFHSFHIVSFVLIFFAAYGTNSLFHCPPPRNSYPPNSEFVISTSPHLPWLPQHMNLYAPQITELVCLMIMLCALAWKSTPLACLKLPVLLTRWLGPVLPLYEGCSTRFSYLVGRSFRRFLRNRLLSGSSMKFTIRAFRCELRQALNCNCNCCIFNSSLCSLVRKFCSQKQQEALNLLVTEERYWAFFYVLLVIEEPYWALFYMPLVAEERYWALFSMPLVTERYWALFCMPLVTEERYWALFYMPLVTEERYWALFYMALVTEERYCALFYMQLVTEERYWTLFYMPLVTEER